MRKLLILSLLLTGIGEGQFAHAYDPIAPFIDAEPKPYYSGVLRFSGGYAVGDPYDMKPSADIKSDQTKGFWGEFDLGMFFMLHFGFAQLKNKEASVDFNSAGHKSAELSFDKYQYGVKLLLPFKYLNPFVGGGVMSGHLELQDTSSNNGVSEHSRLTGRYWHAGFDVLFSPFIGLRLVYHNDTIETRKFNVLGNTKINLEQHLGQAGLLLYF